MSQARQPKGRPTGGEFASTMHAEADVALREPAVHGEMAILQALRTRNEAARELKRELTRVHLQGAVEALRRAFPDAAEVRVVRAKDGRGKPLAGFVPTRLLHRDGNDATAGDQHWSFRGVEHGMSPATHLSECDDLYGETELVGWDEGTEELVLPLDRDYWKEDQP